VIVESHNYARKLLDDLGALDVEVSPAIGEHPAVSLATSGLVAMTGRSGGPGGRTVCQRALRTA